jgi:hypothetical protein
LAVDLYHSAARFVSPPDFFVITTACRWTTALQDHPGVAIDSMADIRRRRIAASHAYEYNYYDVHAIKLVV